MADCYRTAYIHNGDVNRLKSSILEIRNCAFIEKNGEWILVHLPLSDNSPPAFLKAHEGWSLHLFSTPSVYGFDLIENGVVRSAFSDQVESSLTDPPQTEEEFRYIKEFVESGRCRLQGHGAPRGWPNAMETIYYDQLRQMLTLAPTQMCRPLDGGPNELILKLLMLEEPDASFEDLLKAQDADPEEFRELFASLTYVCGV
jgi:hypothetical protein